MQPQNEKRIEHGGSVTQAARQFPDAPRPWIDLSTGINPHSYGYSPVPATAFSRLPEPSDLTKLCETAARCYGASSGENIAAAPGTHLLVPMVAQHVFGGRKPSTVKAAILSPTYAEHAHACRMAGFDTVETTDFAALAQADLAIVVNPNNPDGRLIADHDLLALSEHLVAKGGLLVVDEAFRDVMDEASGLVGKVHAALVVLRSFGKFYGLAGIRLGFAVAPKELAQDLRLRLGPWAIPGPALHIGLEALADEAWQAEMRQRLRAEADRLNALLKTAKIEVAGGTTLFRYIRDGNAQAIYQHLGEAGILVRRFNERPNCLRIGLPAPDEWLRLEEAICSGNWQR
ncbi:threonine-phosphate decarboxylase CobD [Rhizobium lemnae]|uniref:threonine-phosphate decarboxylase n=1 Tax=Rhizobium lemnae TaxID=1214924 RepID=A0ABV8EBX5_9HYPH|nr:threonine-phosphate decarboxylase CobD [Rhizobium lemnae]MCJ8509963.1 threonine-phosphate decarboxylase CobD [Rhizobium lemnae]